MPVGSGRSATARLAASTTATTLLVAAATVAAGWPYWERHRLAAVPNVAVAVALVVAGMLLRGDPSSRRCGELLALGGLCCPLTWLMSWDVGPLPLIAVLGQSVYWVAYAWGLLLYPGNTLRGRADRWWVTSAAVILLGGQVLTVVISRPSWNGFTDGVLWPAPLLVGRARFEAALDVLLVLYVLVPVTFVLLAVARIRAARGLERVVAGPVLLSAGFVALVTAVTYPGLMAEPELGRVEDAVALQGAASIVTPVALLAVGAHRRLLLATTADRLGREIGSPTPASVRAALRALLRDATLEVYYRQPDTCHQPDTEVLVDLHGQVVDLPPEDHRGERSDRPGPEQRWYVPVRSAAGAPVAVLSIDPVLCCHRRQVAAALAAAAAALEQARAQSGLRAQLVRLGEERRRAARTQAHEWALVGRELDDGVRRRLAELAAAAGDVARTVSEPATARALAEIGEGLRAAHGELADIAREAHPAVLERDGLLPALESLAAGLGLGGPSLLRVPAGRFDTTAERAMYAALAAALRAIAAADAVPPPDTAAGMPEPAAAGPVVSELAVGPGVSGLAAGPAAAGPTAGRREWGAARVEVRAEGAMLVGEVTCAVPVAGGVRAAADHARALGGWVAVRGAAGGATTTRVTVPCG
ncbi:hypothetical protein [Parafrankia sp. BMG5.11]|uniref:hypothetical protein n=1 Tax=Parafrankia sp. BMG5.11 TaxID=222540 RepID=UPI00103A4F9A|nr:hypothetical protein [Parafrankia sp. BMG5.11]TCJ33865.1 hypothetical protein E0504_35980 [Parafrankia sp. BMG5.11]